MQSFLQYRRFERHVRAQYERDQEKARGLGQHGEKPQSPSDAAIVGSLDSTESSRTPVNLSSEDFRDPERAEHSRRYGKDEEDVGPAASRPPSKLEGLTPTQERDEIDMLSRARTLTGVNTYGTVMGTTLTGIDVRERTTKEGGDRGKVFVVGYEGEKDLMNPHNWSFATRLGATSVAYLRESNFGQLIDPI